MKKLNTILSFASLAITSFLLVFLIFAWYVTNKNANVTDTIGNVSSIEELIDTVEYYNFQSVEGNTYTVRQYVKHICGDNEDTVQIRYYSNDGTEVSEPDTSLTDPYDDNFKMNQFDYLKQSHSKYLIKITLKQGKSLGQLQFISTAGYFIGFSNGAGDGSVTNVANLSMSSVIKFGYLTTAPTITNNHSRVTITNVPSDNIEDQNHYEHFDYTNGGFEYNGAISTNKKTIASSINPATENDSVVAYVLVDYNVDALNAFYGYNLSTSGLWTSPSAPEFTALDFKILVLG